MTKKRLGVWGWWQGRNLGDNWIRLTISKLFPEAEFITTVTTDFSAYDFVICGGGGLFIYDVIRPWINYSQKPRYGTLGLGAEFPHKSDQAYQLSRNADFFYVRDQYSLDCMKVDDIERSYDITFASPLKFVEDEELNLDQLFFVWRNGRNLLGNPLFHAYIRHEENEPVYKQVIAEEFKRCVAHDFQTRDHNIEQHIKGCGFVISGRFHGIVAAIHKGLPCVAIDICPKIRQLMIDCGLEEYCIKISEVDKLPSLIRKAKKEQKQIREKQWAYRQKATATLLRQLDHAKACIDKVLYPMRILHYGSYCMRQNDVVKAMADDLCKVSDCVEIDLKAYTQSPDKRIKSKVRTRNGFVCTLDTEKIKQDIETHHPDAIVLNAGGLVLEDSGFKLLAQNKIASVGMSLSDPDIFPYNGKIFGHKFDLFYTNSKHSFMHQYDKKQVHLHHLPFAASIQHHYYMPEVEKKYDVVVVGHSRGSRNKVITALSKRFNMGLYGKGWPNGLGEVNGLAHTRAINTGKMYLSFAGTFAGYENVKVGLFEAMACNQVVITRYMDEIKDLFEIGKEILCYHNENELEEIIDYYLCHPEEREVIRQNAYQRFLREHTYVCRWKDVKQHILKETKS